MQRGTRNVRTMEIFCILIVIMVSQVYTVVKIHWTVYLKWGDFTISQSYLNTLLIFLKRVKFHSIIFIGTEPIFFCKPKIHAQGSHLSGGEAYARSRPDHGPIIAPTYKEGADLPLHNPVANSSSFSKICLHDKNM